MNKKKHISLFSGIGGFDLAAEWMGWENVAHCEWNPFGQRVLKYYWPNAISYHDITQTDFTVHRGQIYILTGGFPCQPYSMAGKRKGKEDERHLWPEMLRAIREIAPRWVVGENVRGLINWNGGLVFDEVQADLEAEGYEVQPFLLPAAGVNAPHERYRIWFVAFNPKCKSNGGHNTGASSGDGLDLEGDELVQTGWEQSSDKPWSSGIDATNPSNSRPESMRRERENSVYGSGTATYSQGTDEQWNRLCPSKTQGQVGRCSCCYDAAYANSLNWREQQQFRFGERERTRDEFEGCYSKATANTNNQRRKECDNAGESEGPRRFNRRILQPQNWDCFPTQPPVRLGNDGFSSESLRQRIREDCMGVISEKEIDKILSKAATEWRNESIKAGGNAIVPELTLQIFKAIEAYDLLTP